MSFNAYLVGVVTFLALLVPFLSVYSFIRGYSLGVKDYNAEHPDEPKTDPERRAKAVPSATDEKLKMYTNLLENIENYDGTDANQKEIR